MDKKNTAPQPGTAYRINGVALTMAIILHLVAVFGVVIMAVQGVREGVRRIAVRALLPSPRPSPCKGEGQTCARSSVRIERQPPELDAAGSNPAGRTSHPARPGTPGAGFLSRCSHVGASCHSPDRCRGVDFSPSDG